MSPSLAGHLAERAIRAGDRDEYARVRPHLDERERYQLELANGPFDDLEFLPSDRERRLADQLGGYGL